MSKQVEYRGDREMRGYDFVAPTSPQTTQADASSSGRPPGASALDNTSDNSGEGNFATEMLRGLITREIPKLRQLAWKLVRDNDHADDLVQDTVIRVLVYGHTWEGGTNFGAWARAVMRNMFYTQCGQRARESQTFVEDETWDKGASASQDDQVICGELATAIDQLPHPQRTSIKLSAYEGLNADEIATKMGISPNAVRCHLLRARKNLRESFSIANARTTEGRVVRIVREADWRKIPREA